MIRYPLDTSSLSDVVRNPHGVDLERAGRAIDANNLLIATHAVTLDLTLVPDNERDFRRIRGLVVENWPRAIAAR